jgi:hypothetical protein
VKRFEEKYIDEGQRRSISTTKFKKIDSSNKTDIEKNKDKAHYVWKDMGYGKRNKKFRNTYSWERP